MNVRFYVNHNKLCLKIEGHAATAPKGEDLVCAGTSTLAAALADFVALMDAHGETEGEPTIKLNNGYALIKVKPREDAKGKLLLAFSVIATGMSALRRNYPQNINLKLFEQSEIEDFSK